MKKDRITEMAKAGLALQENFGKHLGDVTGQPEMDSDDLTDLYMKANYDQRHTMFTEVLGAQGADGLKLLGEVFKKAQERLVGGA